MAESILLAFTVALVSCAGAQASSHTHPPKAAPKDIAVSPNTNLPSNTKQAETPLAELVAENDTEKVATSDEENHPPLELALDNIRMTDITAYVEITATEIDDPHPGQGYVNHVYTARVQQVIAGDPPTVFSFSEMAESSATPRVPGTRQLVSLCKGNDAIYYSPDVGFVFDATEAFVETVKAGAESNTDNHSSACE